jgi:hypothetical protein
MTRVRQAVADDIPELVRLRAMPFETRRRLGQVFGVVTDPAHRRRVDHPEPALYWRPQRRNA